jgi:putative membrane protein
MTGLMEPASQRLADGEWHRLYPATPLLRGGFAFVAIAGFVILNTRDALIQLVLGGPNDGPQDPVAWVIDNGWTAGILGLIALGLLLFITGFYISWRMHTFRITDELVEVRSGILFRTSRRGRLDRIQGVNISRPLLARIFGAAKLEVVVAGHDGNVELAFLGSAAADELRREILLLASGSQSTPGEQVVRSGGLIEKRARELLAPELDPTAAPPESVVQMHLGRLLGSVLLSGFTVGVILTGVVIATIITTTHQFGWLFALVPTFIGMGSYYVSRFTRSVRYSIAATPDGVRVGFGLLSTSNETLPPGRIHAIQVSQPLLWRPAGWWHITINRAARGSGRRAEERSQTTVLPVGHRADVMKVLSLLLPGLDEDVAALLNTGMAGRGAAGDGFTNSPLRAAWLRWFAWRRNGFAITPELVLLRRGIVWRHLVVVPQARMQSVALHQGPLLRVLRLASVRVHTVVGPIDPELRALDAAEAARFFAAVEDAALNAAAKDTTHRWRESAAGATA